jgi:hypothetical protein
MAHHEGELLSDRDLKRATDEQLFTMIAKLDMTLRERGMAGIDRRETDELEPPDPADP